MSLVRANRQSKRLVIAVVGALSVLSAISMTTRPAAATWFGVNYSVAAAVGGALAPNSPPPGANDWSCRPSAAHPRPVVLVHGTFANEDVNWATLSPLLANNGYCVFTFNYGGPPLLGVGYGVGDIAAGARVLAGFVDQVGSATGSDTVDLVGHSQGGMMPRYYLKFLGGAPKVTNLVALAPSSHGTSPAGMLILARLFPDLAALSNEAIASLCTACAQQSAGSAFLTTLNAGGDTVPGVTYTVISTKYDEVVMPYTSQFLTGPGVHNITIQNQCPFDFDGHLGMAFDHIALGDVLNALDPAHASRPLCTFIGFDLGG